MTRIAIASGGHFDASKATKFREATQWDGRNHISVATGSQWEHQDLYLTKKGAWILNSYSNYQGTIETYDRIDEETAVSWLISNQCDISELDETLQAKIERIIVEQEV